MNNLNTLRVMTDGTLDVDATVSAVRSALELEVEAVQASIDAVAPAVSAVFEANAGKRLSQEYVATQVCSNVEPSAMRATSEAAKMYMAQQISAGNLDSKKGRRGGTCRVSDLTQGDPADS